MIDTASLAVSVDDDVLERFVVADEDVPLKVLEAFIRDHTDGHLGSIVVKGSTLMSLIRKYYKLKCKGENFKGEKQSTTPD